MSIGTIEQQVAHFLARETPEVISIKGAWGVGKTYAWNNFLNKARQQKKIALAKYSYVSLFGISSLNDLKFAIFENMVELSTLGRKSTVESFRQNVAELQERLGKKSLPLFSSNALASHSHSMLDALSFLALERTIICIDDFERKGQSIAAQDSLGLITQLKEQKKCKVALILNDENLKDDSSIDYARLREKVVDTELRFAPTAEDCVQIALPQNKIAPILSANIVRLKINNIRIIKKIEKLASLLAPQLTGYDEQVMGQALRSLTLLTWCYYSQSQEVPDYNFVLGRVRLFHDPEEDLNLTPQQQNWCALLRAFDDFALDGFDLLIAQLVENGYLNETELKTEAKRLNEKIQAERSTASLQEAWRKFNESFADNAKEVVEALSNSFSDNARHISPIDLDGSVRLLRYLGKNALASRIIDLYIQKRGEERALFRFNSNSLEEVLKDPELIAKFQQKLKSLQEKPALADILERLRCNGEAQEEEIEMLLAQTPVQDYVALFKSQKGPKLTEYIDICLKFGRLGGPTEFQHEIAEKTTAALKIIGAESKLNASRVRRFGIRVEG